ncbi:MAG: NAD(P)H-binding protein [Aeromicrobium sp.]
MVRVLVTGARGKTGRPLAESLAARREVEVAGGGSHPATVDIDGVRPVAFSWDDPAGWAAALDGIDAVYVVRPDRADAPELVAALLDLAAPTARVVLLSEQDADFAGPDGWAPRVERAVRESGRPWTIVRPSWFMQVFSDERFYRHLLVDGGDLPFPSGGARVAWIDARDIAAVAEQALLDESHAGRVHEISGPEALSLPHTAELLAAAAGHRVTHRELSIDEAVAGSDGFQRELEVLTFERVRAGSFATVTDTVQRVTGQPARSLQAFLDELGRD